MLLFGMAKHWKLRFAKGPIVGTAGRRFAVRVMEAERLMLIDPSASPAAQAEALAEALQAIRERSERRGVPRLG